MTSIVFTNAVHVLAAVIWVGGMFFAVLVLRPSAGALKPSDRLPLWGRVFGKFFPLVWARLHFFWPAATG